MSGFPLLICFVTVVVFRHLAFVESQDFCESYQKNNYSLIVFSQSNDTILLIVDKHFWRLKEEGKELVFNRTDFQASNSSEQWSETNYTFAHSVYDHLLSEKNDTYDNPFRGIVLFKYKESKVSSKEHIFKRDYYVFNENYFSDIQQSSNWSDNYQNNRIGFSIFNKGKDFEVIQMFDHTLKRFYTKEDRFISHYRKGSNKYGFYRHLFEVTNISISIGNNQIYTQIEKLRNFTNDIPMIGTYLSSLNQIICFFRIEDDIKYCTIDECERENYKLLISCSSIPRSDSEVWIIVVIFMAIVLLIIIAVIIILWYNEYQKKYKSLTIPESSLAQTTESMSFSTVDTINSKNTSKTQKSGTIPNKVLSQKSQNTTESTKSNVRNNQKKSQKTKKL